MRMTTKKTEAKIQNNRKLIVQALTDPKFRKLLETEPEKAVGLPRLSATNKTEIRFILASVKQIEAHINGLADELLCANGGCGIVAGVSR
jgi:hypothetical protein